MCARLRGCAHESKTDAIKATSAHLAKRHTSCRSVGARMSKAAHFILRSRSVAIAIAGLLYFATQVSAQSATLAWNANTESDLAGYIVEYGNAIGVSVDQSQCRQGDAAPNHRAPSGNEILLPRPRLRHLGTAKHAIERGRLHGPTHDLADAAVADRSVTNGGADCRRDGDHARGLWLQVGRDRSRRE